MGSVIRWIRFKMKNDQKKIDGLPFKCGKSGGWNCVPSDAKCDGKNIGGVARGALPSSKGRYPFVLKPKTK